MIDSMITKVLLLRSLTLILTSIVVAGITNAHTIIVSNLSEREGIDFSLAASTGPMLPAGVIGRIGCFAGLTDAEITTRAASAGLAGLMTAFSPFEDDFLIGEGSDGAAGHFEISRRRPLEANDPLTNCSIFVVILNASIAAEATECLVLKFPARFEADVAPGLDRQTAVHLNQATVLYGMKNDQGFHLEIAQASSFDGWAQSMLGGCPASEQAASADADGDGTTNLDEFVCGTDPGRTDAVAMLTAESVTAKTFTVLLRRVVHLPLVVELTRGFDFLTEEPIDLAAASVLSDPSLPPGVALYRVSVPAVETRLFVRPRITIP
jgi:hypothetical protein